jgi:hypothetical protein
MADLDAYRPPQAPTDQVPPGDASQPCPSCQNTSATKVKFTWWGGAVGPALFHVVQCTRCRTRFNGKTGGSLRNVIIVYQLVGVAIAGLVLYALYFARH